MRGLRAFILCAAIAAVAAPAAAQTWRVETDRDQFTDERRVRAIVQSGRLAVAVRCHGGRLDALFLTSYIGESDATIRYRIDQGEVFESVWDASTSRDGLFAFDPGEVGRRMAAGSSMAFEHDDFSGTPHRYRVPLTGSSAAIGRVFDACDVPREDPRKSDGEIWVRAVDDLDKLDKSLVGTVQEFLTQLDYAVPPTGRRTVETYRRLSDFYSDYWSKCRAGGRLTRACERWAGGSTDYPVEPLELLVEVAGAKMDASDTAITEAFGFQWAVAPRPEMPMRAAERGVASAAASVSCSVNAAGNLSRCTVQSEDPVGMGFGSTAVRALANARLAQSAVQSLGRDEPVVVRITFQP